MILTTRPRFCYGFPTDYSRSAVADCESAAMLSSHSVDITAPEAQHLSVNLDAGQAGADRAPDFACELTRTLAASYTLRTPRHPRHSSALRSLTWLRAVIVGHSRARLLLVPPATVQSRAQRSCSDRFMSERTGEHYISGLEGESIFSMLSNSLFRSSAANQPTSSTERFMASSSCF